MQKNERFFSNFDEKFVYEEGEEMIGISYIFDIISYLCTEGLVYKLVMQDIGTYITKTGLISAMK